MADYTLIAGSNARVIEATLSNSISTDDLSTAQTALLYCRAKGATSNRLNGVSASIVTSVGDSIDVRYIPSLTDFPFAGHFLFYWKVTYQSGRVDRFPSDENSFNTLEVTRNYE